MKPGLESGGDMRVGTRQGCRVFRVSRGVLIAVFRLGTSNGRDRGEVQVKHWELLLVSKSLLVCSPLLPVLGLNIVWSIWSRLAKDGIKHLK